jgi:hypothetical protein
MKYHPLCGWIFIVNRKPCDTNHFESAAQPKIDDYTINEFIQETTIQYTHPPQREIPATFLICIFLSTSFKSEFFLIFSSGVAHDRQQKRLNLLTNPKK